MTSATVDFGKYNEDLCIYSLLFSVDWYGDSHFTFQSLPYFVEWPGETRMLPCDPGPMDVKLQRKNQPKRKKLPKLDAEQNARTMSASVLSPQPWLEHL